MSPSLTYLVSASTQKETGLFVSREVLSEEITDSLESADPGTFYVDESEYSTDEWRVEEFDPPGAKDRLMAAAALDRAGGARNKRVADWLRSL